MIRTERLCRQLLRLLDHRYRMAQIVQRLHGIDVDTDAPFSEELHELRIAPSMLMSRNVEGNDPVSPETFQRLIDRRSCLR